MEEHETKSTKEIAKTMSHKGNETATKLEELAKQTLASLELISEPEEKSILREKACGQYQSAAIIRSSHARRHRQDGELQKSITEYLRSAEDYVQCGKISCEDDRNERATICFDEAITQYYEAGREDLIIEIHREYGQLGIKKQLILGKMYFPLDDDQME
ncbi:MAG: hypothetical protein WBF38_02455 [Nitrosotalea sp.]